jgi:hypothetical protein
MESPLLSRNEDIELGSAYGNAAQGFSQLHSASQPRHSYHSSHQLRAVQTSFRERLHDFNHKWSASWLPEITSLVFAYAMFIGRKDLLFLVPMNSLVFACRISELLHTLTVFHVVIIVVLRFSDSKRDISWPLGLSLNAFLALCSTLVRVAFMVPIAEGLGQLKWIWFGSRKPRPMDHFKAFDNASRGIWGSLVLLFSLKGYCPYHITSDGLGDMHPSNYEITESSPLLEQSSPLVDFLSPQSPSKLLKRECDFLPSKMGLLQCRD